MKKTFAAAILGVFFLSAALPAAAWLLPVAVNALGYAGRMCGTHALQCSIALHSAVLAIPLIYSDQNPPANPMDNPLVLQIDPYTPLVPPESAQQQPSVVDASSSQDSYQGLYFWGCANFGSPVPRKSSPGLCFDYMKSKYPDMIKNGEGYNSSSQYYIQWQRPGISSGTALINKGTTACADGYTWDGTSCNGPIEYTCPAGYTLNTSDNKCYNPNPDEVADGKARIDRILDKFVKNPNDPDPLPTGASISADEKTTTVQDTQGNKTDVKINADGSVTVTVTETDSEGKTTSTTTTQISAPSGGQAPQVTGQTSTTSTGTGTETSGTPAQAVQVVGGSINFDKTGLATDGKQCGYDAAHPCKVDLKGDGEYSTDEIDKTAYEDASEAHKSLIDEIGEGGDHGFTWDWNPFETFPSGSCTTPQISVGFVNWTITDFCSKVAYMRSFMEFVLYLTTGFILFGVVTGRKAE